MRRATAAAFFAGSLAGLAPLHPIEEKTGRGFLFKLLFRARSRANGLRLRASAHARCPGIGTAASLPAACMFTQSTASAERQGGHCLHSLLVRDARPEKRGIRERRGLVLRSSTPRPIYSAQRLASGFSPLPLASQPDAVARRRWGEAGSASGDPLRYASRLRAGSAERSARERARCSLFRY